jgi:hypothetical protein
MEAVSSTIRVAVAFSDTNCFCSELLYLFEVIPIAAINRLIEKKLSIIFLPSFNDFFNKNLPLRKGNLSPQLLEKNHVTKLYLACYKSAMLNYKLFYTFITLKIQEKFSTPVH